MMKRTHPDRNSVKTCLQIRRSYLGQQCFLTIDGKNPRGCCRCIIGNFSSDYDEIRHFLALFADAIVQHSRSRRAFRSSLINFVVKSDYKFRQMAWANSAEFGEKMTNFLLVALLNSLKACTKLTFLCPRGRNTAIFGTAYAQQISFECAAIERN